MKIEYDIKEIKRRMDIIREKRGYSLEQLADRMNTSLNQLAKLRAGERKWTYSWLLRAANALNCTISELIEEKISQSNIDYESLQKAVDAVEKVISMRNLKLNKREVLENAVKLYEKITEYKSRGEQVEISPVIAELVINQK